PIAMGRVASLRHDTLEALGARLIQERLAASADVATLADGVVRDAANQRDETLLALLQRQGAQVRAVEMQEIEHDVAQVACRRRRAERLLEALEAGAPVGVEYGALPVEPRRLDGQAGARPCHRPEALAPVLAA